MRQCPIDGEQDPLQELSGYVEGTAVACAVVGQARTPADLHRLGGRDRRRSGDLALFRRALYQLSYPTLAPGSLSGADRQLSSAYRGGGPDGI